MPSPTIDGIIIPEQWRNLLASIQINDPTAMIAGGALRDLSLGRAPRDLDIFTANLPEREDLQSSDVDYDGMQYIIAVVSFPTDIGIPFNLVLHEPCSNQEMLESFDFGLCQISFNGISIIKTPAYEWDFKYGIFTLRHTDRYRRSIKRYARWLDRYDWEIVIPELEPKESF